MIRKAKKGDIKDILILLEELFTQEKEFEFIPSSHAKALKKIMKNKKMGKIFVYEFGDKVVGSVMLLFTFSSALGKKVAILEDFIVSHHYRSNGLGGELPSHAINYCDKKGYERVTLLCDVLNTKAQKLYTKHGFKASTMIPLRRHNNGNG